MPMTDENAATGQLLTRRDPPACGNLVNGYTGKRCLEIERHRSRLSLPLLYSLLRFIIPGVFHHKCFNFLHTDKLQPEVNVISLMFKPRTTDTLTPIVTLSTNIDDQGPRNLQHRTVYLTIEGEQHIPLTDKINQLFKFIGIGKIPHRNTEDYPISLLKTLHKRLYSKPNRQFGAVHWLL